jgi:hypothetical protein
LNFQAVAASAHDSTYILVATPGAPKMPKLPDDMSQAAVFKRHILSQNERAERDKAPVVPVAKKVRIAKKR